MQISIQRADNSLYAAVIDDVIAVKIGAGAWCPETTLEHDQGCHLRPQPSPCTTSIIS